MLKAEHLKHQNLTSDSQCHKLQNKQQIFNRYIKYNMQYEPAHEIMVFIT